MSEKYQYFNGLKFYLDSLGYYQNSETKKRMHRYVWEFYNGPIPKGYDIHHKDENKANNDITYLEMKRKGKHQADHAKKWHERNPGAADKNLKKAREKAKNWHKSEEGKEWHKRQMEMCSTKRKLKCRMCGKDYETTSIGHSEFCSIACYARWRRKTGADNTTRICVICGKEFSTNKYGKVRCCSKSCAATWRNRRASE